MAIVLEDLGLQRANIAKTVAVTEIEHAQSGSMWESSLESLQEPPLEHESHVTSSLEELDPEKESSHMSKVARPSYAGDERLYLQHSVRVCSTFMFKRVCEARTNWTGGCTAQMLTPQVLSSSPSIDVNFF